MVATMRSRPTFDDQINSGPGNLFSFEELVRSARITLSNRRFWRVQWFIPVLLVAHIVLEYADDHSSLHVGGFVVDSLLIVPVILVSGEFGTVGALATSLLGSVVLLMNLFVQPHTTHETWAEWTILVGVVLTALLIGWRDDQVRAQRERFDFATTSSGVAVWEYDVERDRMRRSQNHDGLYGLAWQKPWRITTFLDATHPDDRAYAGATIEHSLAPGGPDEYNYDFRVVWPDSTIHWLWVRGKVTMRDEMGHGQLVRGVLIDVTERKELELANLRLRMLYAALSECNQAVVYARDEMDLFERIVNATTQVGTASMTWVGLFDEPDRPARPVASAGAGATEFLAARELISAGVRLPTWPATEAATTGEIVLRGLASDDIDELSRLAAAHGFRSVAALPVSRRGEVVAAVSMYSTEANAFSEDLRPLFSEMVKDLSFSLDLFEDQRLHGAAELELRESEERFRGVIDQSVIGIYLARDGQLLVANPTAASLLGFDSVDALLGADRSAFHASLRDQPVLDFPHHAESEHEQIISLERPDGSAAHLRITPTTVTLHDGPAQLGVIDDVTALVELDIIATTHLRETEGLLRATVSMATSISEQRDPFTAGHQQRVAEIAASIGEAMGLDPRQVEGLRVAGQLHDIGKMVVPSEILTRPGRLNDVERRLIQLHARTGYDVLQDIPFPWPIALVALQHHERMDGSGYPQGLKGTEILLDARIVAVADVLEAMSAHRPYRASLGLEAALSEIEEGAGSRYDADVVAACVHLARAGKLPM